MGMGMAGGGGGGNITAGLENVPLPELEARLLDAKAGGSAFRIFRARNPDRRDSRGRPGRPAPPALGMPGPGPVPNASRPAAKVAKLELPECEAIAREAYLRTLSRKPTDSELATATHHLAEALDGARGMRDLLWALLNTKEFLTNH